MKEQQITDADTIVYAATRYHVFLTIGETDNAEEWRKTLMVAVENYLWGLPNPDFTAAAQAVVEAACAWDRQRGRGMFMSEADALAEAVRAYRALMEDAEL
jgi:hypothetical protein